MFKSDMQLLPAQHNVILYNLIKKHQTTKRVEYALS